METGENKEKELEDKMCILLMDETMKLRSEGKSFLDATTIVTAALFRAASVHVSSMAKAIGMSKEEYKEYTKRGIKATLVAMWNMYGIISDEGAKRMLDILIGGKV